MKKHDSFQDALRSRKYIKNMAPVDIEDLKSLRTPPDIDEQNRLYKLYGDKLHEIANATHTYPQERFSGRGIVMCAGGQRYFTCAYVAVRMLRDFGCTLPIEFWYLGVHEMNAEMEELVKPLGVTCVDAYKVRREHPSRILNGWELNPYSIIHSKFKEVLFLDADNLPVVNPEFLFETEQYKQTGAIFWPDYLRLGPDRSIWRICKLPYKDEAEFESGQIVIDKERCWKELQVTMWINEHSDFFYRHIHGDKETYHMAWKVCGTEYSIVPHKIKQLPEQGRSIVMCQHDFDGNVIFQHRNMDKWKYSNDNMLIPGFKYDARCRELISELKEKWDGKVYDAANDSKAAKEVHAEISKKRFFWYIVDGRSRYIEFLSDGTIGHGKSFWEKSWRVEDEGNGVVLTIIGDPRITCKLRRVSPTQWQGYRLENGSHIVLR